jgi:hypothetical protein
MNWLESQSGDIVDMLDELWGCFEQPGLAGRVIEERERESGRASLDGAKMIGRVGPRMSG